MADDDFGRLVKSVSEVITAQSYANALLWSALLSTLMRRGVLTRDDVENEIVNGLDGVLNDPDRSAAPGEEMRGEIQTEAVKNLLDVIRRTAL